MTLDPPHFVPRFDNVSVNSPYWQQAPFYIASGIGPPGVNPYGPDEGTLDIVVPFSPAEARHANRANVVFLDGHLDSLTLEALGYVLVNGIPQLQTRFTTPFPGSNALWNGRGVDEFSPAYGVNGP